MNLVNQHVCLQTYIIYYHPLQMCIESRNSGVKSVIHKNVPIFNLILYNQTVVNLFNN